ncbi:MAG: SOS response-associated peptidase [Syntrophomonadaceae bacterium]|jgi:putative SOS response-associated peptidase YedK
MCGRYTLTININTIIRIFSCLPADFDIQPRYNIAPTQIVPVVINSTGLNQLKLMRWGLVPFWAKDISMGNRMINTHIETITKKPAFRNAIRRRRCIVPAGGYYEWQQQEKGKQPMRIVTKFREVFGFAGIWETRVNNLLRSKHPGLGRGRLADF